VQGLSNCSKSVEQIKEDISMPELLQRYGIKVNRARMIHCPFHGDDRHPSMKVYPDSVHCFACGFHGDIFDFVRKMDNCDFKTAYFALGGSYDHNMANSSREILKASYERKRAEKKAKEEAERKFFFELTFAMEICRCADEICEIFSDNWCYLVDKRDWLNYCYELKYLDRKEVNEIDVIRICREVRKRGLALG